MKEFELTRTKQCETCPWRVEADTKNIPGYDRDLHCNLSSTISPREPNVYQQIEGLTSEFNRLLEEDRENSLKEAENINNLLAKDNETLKTIYHEQKEQIIKDKTKPTWQEGKTIVLYKWTWHCGYDEHKAVFHSEYSLSSEPNGDGWIEFLDHLGTTQKLKLLGTAIQIQKIEVSSFEELDKLGSKTLIVEDVIHVPCFDRSHIDQVVPTPSNTDLAEVEIEGRKFQKPNYELTSFSRGEVRDRVFNLEGIELELDIDINPWEEATAKLEIGILPHPLITEKMKWINPD